VILDAVRSKSLAHTVFPSWSSGLKQGEVDQFLQYVSDFKAIKSNPYIREIRACGNNPFAILLVYYYRRLVQTGLSPDFFGAAPTSKEDAELHNLLVACYRVLLDGKIGRTREFAEKCLKGQYPDLDALGDAMSRQFLHIGLSSSVNLGWLRAALLRTDKQRAKRIFNACLLPLKTGKRGASFAPIVFGRGSKQFNVDHLIPESMGIRNSSGYAEINGIGNFAPLPSNQNRAAKATSCSTKLAKGGIFDVYLQGQAHPAHPYCTWLVQNHALMFAGPQLDDQRLLEVNATPAVADARVDQLQNLLVSRI
jgi:hypothetical protein